MWCGNGDSSCMVESCHCICHTGSFCCKEDFCQFWGYVGCVDFGTSILSLKPPLMPDAEPLSPLKSCLLGCCRFWCLCHGPRHLFLSHEASDENIERTVYRRSFGCPLAITFSKVADLKSQRTHSSFCKIFDCVMRLQLLHVVTVYRFHCSFGNL